jgi:purine-binding chemotaxis protein CheW
MSTLQICTFHLADLVCGVDVRHVQEVVRYQEMTRVPHAPPVVRGLINLRGQIVTALDMRTRFELPPRPPEQLPMNVVARTGDGTVSLLVDEIGDVLEVDAASVETPPLTMRGAARHLVRAVCKLPDCLLLIIEIDSLVNISPPSAAA